MRFSGPRVAPISGAARQVVVLLHGFGANGDDLIGLAEYFRAILPDALYVAPDAPNICALNPAGLEWFDLSEANPDRVAKLAAAARPALATYLEELWIETGLAAGESVLIGFSQGAMMALEVGLRLAHPVLGIVGFSGALPGAASLASEIRSRPPVCLLHGSA
ncbi:MAG: alpha/beta fold hydrolase, partial [Cucumibacter sp.]